MREVDGWVYSSEPLWVQVSDEVLRMRRLRERVSPSGDLVRRVHDDVLHRLTPEQLEAEALPRGPAPGGAPHDPIQRPGGGLGGGHPGGAVSLAPLPARAARAGALSRADEHLRGPRQHHLPAAPLRVARDRLLLRRLGPRRGLRPRPARPALHRRRPGPRPGPGRRGHAAHEARRDRLRGRGRRRAAGRLRRLPAARPQLPARRRSRCPAWASRTWRRCARRGRG